MRKIFIAPLVAIFVALSLIVGRAQSSGIFFEEGWESGTKTSFNSQNYGNLANASQFSVQNAVRGAGLWSLRHALPANTNEQFVTQHFGDSIAGPVLANGRGQHFMDFYAQWKIYYPTGFDWRNGYKQFIIGTQDDRRHEEVCCNPWVAHYVTIYSRGRGELLAEANNKDEPAPNQWIGIGPNLNGHNRDNPVLIATGRWHTVEIRRRLNDAGADNGIFQMWFNGEMVADWRNLRLRIPSNGSGWGSNFAYGTNFAMISDYSGDPTATGQSIYYDDVKFSTTYIGTSGSTAPAPPTNLRIVSN